MLLAQFIKAEESLKYDGVEVNKMPKVKHGISYNNILSEKRENELKKWENNRKSQGRGIK